MNLTKIQSKKWKINFLINNLMKESDKENNSNSLMDQILQFNMPKIYKRKNHFKKKCTLNKSERKEEEDEKHSAFDFF